MASLWTLSKGGISALMFLYGLSLGWRTAEKHALKCTSQSQVEKTRASAVPLPTVQTNLRLQHPSIPEPCEDSETQMKPIESTARQTMGTPGAVCSDSKVLENRTYLHLWKGDVAKSVFHNLHNPGNPAKWQFVVTSAENWDTEPEEKRPHPENIVKKERRDNAGFRVDEIGSGVAAGGASNSVGDPGFDDFWDPYLSHECTSLILTRTGSRANQPNKCVAVARVPPGSESPVQHSHRVGFTARLTNQYQADYSRKGTLKEESELLPPLLENLDSLEKEFKMKVGSPVSNSGSTGDKPLDRRTVIVLVANEGVFDLLLNFVCSIEKLDTVNKRDIVVFVGTKSFAKVVERMGVHAIHSTALGSMPENAAGSYLDKTFSRMMWFKATSVYLAVKCGFNVLFQDVDLVWLINPIPYLLEIEADMSFMDDGARSPRYTPFFVNSGFYFVKYNSRTRYFEEKLVKSGPSEIGFTHSHQSVLIRHLSESYHHAKLSVYVLDRELFPSGQAYHENKPFIKKITEGKFRPYVFHMCWTSNREDKVKYFKEIGYWYLPEDAETSKKMCSSSKYASSWLGLSATNRLTSVCCRH